MGSNIPEPLSSIKFTLLRPCCMRCLALYHSTERKFRYRVWGIVYYLTEELSVFKFSISCLMPSASSFLIQKNDLERYELKDVTSLGRESSDMNPLYSDEYWLLSPGNAKSDNSARDVAGEFRFRTKVTVGNFWFCRLPDTMILSIEFTRNSRIFHFFLESVMITRLLVIQYRVFLIRLRKNAEETRGIMTYIGKISTDVINAVRFPSPPSR